MYLNLHESLIVQVDLTKCYPCLFQIRKFYTEEVQFDVWATKVNFEAWMVQIKNFTTSFYSEKYYTRK